MQLVIIILDSTAPDHSLLTKRPLFPNWTDFLKYVSQQKYLKPAIVKKQEYKKQDFFSFPLAKYLVWYVSIP